MSTIRDVARLANVSVATVSRVLNGTAKVSDKAREAVLRAREELGFHLNANAKALAQQESETIGVLVSDVSDPYFGTMVRSCEEVAQHHGKVLLVAQGFHEPEREMRAINSLISRQCSGLIIHALALSDELFAKYMKEFPFMVLVNRILPGFEDRCVNINNKRGMYLAVRELTNAGRRRIAYISSSHPILDADERYEGYLQALDEAGIEPDPDLVIAVPPYLESGFEAAKRILKLGGVDGLACYNDALASAAMSTFTREGVKVPEDISVVGFDDLPFGKCLTPPLTTVTNPIEIMGRCATELSLSLYSGEPYTLPEIETRVIRRESIAPKKP
ncbi:MAG: substrate-binding domain-containing protein [Succinivibrio sp.]|jgi:LacI family transcriptional regulator|nr:substrate-binding domain-containing protein [Succinivibrio sp.]